MSAGSGGTSAPTVLTSLLTSGTPVLTLAPMQEVTDGAFWALVHA